MEKRINDINPECKAVKYNLFFNQETKNTILDNKIDFIIDCCDSVESKKIMIIEEIRRTIKNPVARSMRKLVKEEKMKQKMVVVSSKELPKKNGNLLGSNSFV